MTMTGLAIRNLSRNRVRVLLTAFGVAMSITLFLLLRTVIWSYASGAQLAAKDRMVTRHKVTFVMSLPKRYVEEIRNAPHVKQVTWANWFGGKDPKHDREFFATLAVDAATYLDVYDEVKVPPDQLETWKHDKQGCLVGAVLARKLGWKVGDRILLQSGIFGGDWQMNVDGIYTTQARSVDQATLLFHWDYVNDTLPAARKDNVGWIASRVDDPAHVADISAALDKRFEDADTPTLSQDEGSFNASFQAMFSAVLKAMDIISAVILLIMTLILGNTIAMGVRERTSEYGVLRAIGFLPRHVALWIVAESLATGVLGGLLGLAIAWPLINIAFARFVEENLSGMIRYFHLENGTVLLGLVMAALLGAAAAAIPAWRATKLNVVDAIRRVA